MLGARLGTATTPWGLSLSCSPQMRTRREAPSPAPAEVHAQWTGSPRHSCRRRRRCHGTFNAASLFPCCVSHSPRLRAKAGAEPVPLRQVQTRHPCRSLRMWPEPGLQHWPSPVPGLLLLTHKPPEVPSCKTRATVIPASGSTDQEFRRGSAVALPLPEAPGGTQLAVWAGGPKIAALTSGSLAGGLAGWAQLDCGPHPDWPGSIFY